MSDAADFEQWWASYPRKIGKLAAQKAYHRARASGATHEELLAGVAQYIAHKPDYADWCHPTTFLAQGRWLDDYSEPAVKSKPSIYPMYVPWQHRKDA